MRKEEKKQSEVRVGGGNGVGVPWEAPAALMVLPRCPAERHRLGRESRPVGWPGC